MESLNTLESIKNNIESNDIAVIVFATRSCNVCKPLKVKLEKVVNGIETVVISDVFIDEVEEAQGEFQVFTAPITLLFIQGKESKRYSAAMNILEFEETLKRFVNLMS